MFVDKSLSALYHCSQKSCSKCLWISHCLHYGLCHWDYSFEVSICTSKCLLQTLNFIVCALMLCTIPGCQRRVWETEPKVPDYTHCGPKGSDGLAASSAVWKPGGYVTGLGYYSPAPHSSRASRLATVAALHCPVQSLPEWIDVLRPR